MALSVWLQRLLRGFPSYHTGASVLRYHVSPRCGRTLPAFGIRSLPFADQWLIRHYSLESESSTEPSEVMERVPPCSEVLCVSNSSGGTCLFRNSFIS
mgnify:CR=1 FL=1|jgi:hypothetical protein